MKNRMKQFLKTGITFSLFFSLCAAIYIGYVFSDLNEDIDHDEVKELIEKIKVSKEVDERFIAKYDKVNKNALEGSSWNDLMYWIKGEINECPCYEVARRSYINKRHRFFENDYVIAVKLEKEVSQRKCLNYIFQEFNFQNKYHGVEEASDYYFQKPVSELNEDELIGLIVLQENPSLYNPMRRQNLYDKKVAELKLRANF